MEEHKVYTAKLMRGQIFAPFGKCRCGAYLGNQAEIDEHKKLEKRNA